MFSSGKKRQDGPEYLIVGLGNVGRQYENTRHNIGFSIVDALALEKGLKWKKKLYNGEHAELTLSGKKVWLLKPTTYMNLSGLAIAEAAKRFSLESTHILVIYDDIDLETGILRIRSKGGAGTHNGMRSIIEHLKTKDFPRFRIGIGNPENKEALVGHVLGKFSKEELKSIQPVIELSVKAIDCFVQNGIDKTMNVYNSATSQE